MSLNHIEALTDALSRAKAGDLGDNEFKMVVLRSLISLKESHVSLRSRLYDIEGGRYGEDYNSADLTTADLEEIYQSRNAGVRLPAQNKGEMSSKVVSKANGGDREDALENKIKAARDPFNFESVRMFQDLFLEASLEDTRAMTFSKAVTLLTRLDFKYYGDGKYPLSHYLREIVKSDTNVNFPNFIQAISMSINKPIPLGFKEGFEDMDLDHNGKLDAKEVFNMMKQISDSCYSWTDVEDFLESTDVDHDGKMDYAEMLRAFYFT